MFKNKKTIVIEGMKCEHCAKRVHDALLQNEEITKIKVNLKKKHAIIFFESFDERKIKSIIEDLGYKVIEIK